MKRFFSLLSVMVALGASCAVLSAAPETAPNTKTELTLAATPPEGGRVVGQGTYFAGTAVNVVASPAAHYRFVEWVGAAVTNPSSASTNIYIGTTPLRLVAVFEPENVEFKIRIEPANGGTVTGAGQRPYGALVPLSAKPHPGFEFVGWEGAVANPKDTATRLARPLTEGMTIVARFKPIEERHQLAVIAEPPNGGHVTGSGEYGKGTVVPVTAIAQPGFFFNGWVGAVSSRGKSETTFFVNQDATLKAQFVARQVLVAVDVVPQGAGKIEGDTGLIPWRKKIKIKALPEPGYAFSHWEGGAFSSLLPEVELALNEEGDVLLKAHFKRL